jgi:hypothetical protein
MAKRSTIREIKRESTRMVGEQRVRRAKTATDHEVNENVLRRGMRTRRMDPPQSLAGKRSGVLAPVLALVLWFMPPAGLTPGWAAPAVKPLATAVIKATTGHCFRGKTCHVDKAGVWMPRTDVAIVGVSIAEQVDVALYVDIEVSTKPEMYQCNGEDAAGCIFRMKYAGPGLYDYAAISGNTYLGSNVTNTNITFPAGYGIVVKAGVPVYVHLDVRNGSLIDLKVDQDAWLYYVPLN